MYVVYLNVKRSPQDLEDHRDLEIDNTVLFMIQKALNMNMYKGKKTY